VVFRGRGVWVGMRSGEKGVEKAGEVEWGCGLLGFWGKSTGVGR
jgi:hypothetical protein